MGVAVTLFSLRMATNIHWHEGNITREERLEGLGCKGATLWFTGLSASGKSTIACVVEQLLVQRKVFCYRLYGDNVRFGLNSNLGFSPEDREENIQRVSEVAKLFTDAGCVTISSFISPYAADREKARQRHEASGLKFYEVWVATPLALCEERDPKGLYKKARAGEIKQFTGIDAPYEEPTNAELVISTADHSVEECSLQVLAFLEKEGIIKPASQ